MTKKQREREEAREYLREKISIGETLYTISMHVSRSGMSRSIRVYQGQTNLSAFVARAVEMPFDDKNNAVKVGGCGMDMGFHLIHCLSYALHPGEFPATETEEERRIRNQWIFHPTPEGFVPGYSLLHQWM